MNAIRLKTEHLTNPIGVDFQNPRLFWNCDGGKKQTAYQIIAEDDAGKLLWDSGRVESSSMRCTWGGETVKPKTKVLWKLRLWDETNTPGEWAEASFETGIDNWKAKWVTGNYKVDKHQRYPVDCFRKTFSAGTVRKARLYITACGLYEAKLNGKQAGEFVLAPGITDYRKRVQYQTYDVTELLKGVENTLTIQLADGWYRGSCGAWGLKNQYGTETKLLAQLEITDETGKVQTVVTDESWNWSNDGPIRFADNKDGEVFNAQDVPSYKAFAKVTSHSVIPTASNNVPLTEHEHLSAQKIITPSGKTVLDFGQNIAGYVSFSLEAKAGQRITLRFGELLDENGEFTQKNIQCSNKHTTTPLQQVIYTCKEGRNDYKTTFTSRRFGQTVFGQENFGEILFRHESGTLWTEEIREVPYGAAYQDETVTSVEDGPVFIKVTTEGAVRPGKTPISGNSGDYWPGFEHLSFKKEYCFPKHLPYFRLRVTVNFAGCRTKISLRIPVELDPLKAKALYHTPFAATERKPYFEVPYRYRETAHILSPGAYAYAKGDYPALHWIDYSDDKIGLAVANSGTPGCQLVGKEILVSLIRSGTDCLGGTMYPQPGSYDNGEHVFDFVFADHEGANHEAAIAAGEILNRAPVCVSGAASVNYPSIIAINQQNIVVSAIYRDSDNLILRAYECLGKPTQCSMNCGTLECYASDLYGNPTEQLDKDCVEFKPFEIRTFVLKE